MKDMLRYNIKYKFTLVCKGSLFKIVAGLDPDLEHVMISGPSVKVSRYSQRRKRWTQKQAI